MNADKLADALREAEPALWIMAASGNKDAVRIHKKILATLAEYDAKPAQAAQPVGEMPSDAVQMQPEPPATELQTLLNSAVATLRHARTFITSREKMHPTGVELYDDLIEQLDTYAEAQPVGVPDGWVTVPKIPTPEMADAARRWQVSDYVSDPLGDRRKFYNGVYWAMLHAAPQPPAQPSADAEDAALWRFVISEQSRGDIDYAVIRVDWSKCDGNLPRFMEPQDVPEIKAAMAQDSDAARAAEGDA